MTLQARCIVWQARIAQKEEALSRYEQLLHQARDEMAAASRRYEEEIRMMQKQLHEKNELAFKKYKMAVKDSVNQPNRPIASNEQVIHCFSMLLCFMGSPVPEWALYGVYMICMFAGNSWSVHADLPL